MISVFWWENWASGRCSRPRAAVAGGGVLGLLSCPLLSSIASALHLPTLAALLKHKLHLHIFIFSLVKWTHYPFWQVGSSQLDCKLLKGRSYAFCISFASLRLVSRPFYLVRERSKKSFFPFIISAGHGTHSALLHPVLLPLPQSPLWETSVPGWRAFSLLWEFLRNVVLNYCSYFSSTSAWGSAGKDLH